jgi:hypothetical protein
MICTGIGARGQHLGEQGIGIEGDGREQLFEFFVGERVVCRRLFILSSGRRRDGREDRRLGWRWRRGGSWTLLSFNEKRVGGQDCHDR